MDLKVNMVGRWAVWPTMFSIFLAMVSVTWVAEALLYVGLVMTLWATALYFRDGFRHLRGQESSTLKRNLTVASILAAALAPKGSEWTHSPTSAHSPTRS